MLKAILFDLDGTLLPMNEEEFTKGYFGLICKKVVPLGYNKDELINAIWAGTKQMIKNDGTRSNEEIFWDTFSGIFGSEKLKDKALFDEFYSSDFAKTKLFTQNNDDARKVVDFIRQKKLKIILASNPVFPRVGMLTRAGFVGLKESDFSYITSYENSSFAKPNPNYYTEILENNNLAPNEVLFFGNSLKEDYEPATKAGIKAFLVEDKFAVDSGEVERIAFKTIPQIIENCQSSLN